MRKHELFTNAKKYRILWATGIGTIPCLTHVLFDLRIITSLALIYFLNFSTGLLFTWLDDQTKQPFALQRELKFFVLASVPSLIVILFVPAGSLHSNNCTSNDYSVIVELIGKWGATQLNCVAYYWEGLVIAPLLQICFRR